MFKRKLLLSLALFAIIFTITPKNAFAGTCTYTVGNNRMATLDKNNCDPETEYPSVSNYNCVCVVKETIDTSKVPVGTCTCVAGSVGINNCTTDKPNAICEPRSGTCGCYREGINSLADVQNEAQKAAGGSYDYSKQLNSDTPYNPFCTDGKNISTALGCVPTEMKSFITWLLKWLFGVAGGIAFLLMSYGFILIATSGGDEKKVQGAKETITSAIVGLLVCIFALFILRLITVNILQIPGIY